MLKKINDDIQCWCSSSSDCGDMQWQYIEQNGACYNIQSLLSGVDWERADETCRTMNGRLATPSTADQHDAVVNMLRLVVWTRL